MKKIWFAAGLLAFSIGAHGQDQDGSDINKAIPIYFGQNLADIIDSGTKPWIVYSITLDRGQAFSVTAKATSSTASSSNWDVCLLSPATKTVASLGGSNCGQNLNTTLIYDGFGKPALAFEYQVATAGTYYVMIQTFRSNTSFQAQVNAKGTPLVTALPATAGCLTGKVDSVVYSLQLIAAGLPDEVTIGGQRACRSCTVKPPLYTEVASRLENALRSGVNVEACYDSAGSIFQLKLLRQ